MDANDHGEGLMQPAVALGRMLGEIAAMQRKQAEANRHFLGALQAAADRQTQVLEQLAARPVASPTAPGPSAYAGVVVHKMTPEDDVQSYLEMFEAMAGACGWPADEWAIRLLPLLTGEAQTAALGLPPGPRHVYASVKKAIMDRLGLSPEDHRRRFREARLGPGDRPFTFAQRLADAANRWLQPEGAGGGPAVVEKVVTEQFLEGLPPRTAAWVRYHRPTALEAAVTLAEDHLAVHPGGHGEGGRPTTSTQPVPAPRRRSPLPVAARPPPSPRALAPQRGTDPPGLAGTLPDVQRAPQPPGQECWRCGQPGHYRRECPIMEVGQTVRVAGPPAPSPGLGATYGVPVRIQGGIHQAMVDSGCTQSMIHQRLVRPGALVEASRVSIKCVHGDIHDYPVVPIEIRFGGKKHRVRVAVSSRLTHPLILGTDWSGFHRLAGQCAGVRSRPVG
uniref:CCHC-type domain-containing protein n=1 Tax=Gasterosteus aculeatus aculeatus TaxID=481459 RepID=A0AAQ4RXT8_GASAC